MKIAYIAAGAAGMYCGSCIHDNTLATAMQKLGAEVILVPTYTPLRTDETDISINRVFYGGINVYLQQKAALFRHTPNAFDRLLDRPRLLNLLSRFSASTSAQDLGALTVSVLQGEAGRQQKELAKLCQWLKDEFRPDLVHLTNSMFVGFARQLKDILNVPVLCAVQGEDLFLEDLIEPYKTQALALLKERSRDVDGFIAPCRYYANFMGRYLDQPDEKMHVIRLGLNLAGHGADIVDQPDKPFTLGYLARVCPEKGFHIFAEACHLIAQELGHENVRFKAAGYLSPKDEPFLAAQLDQLKTWGLEEIFDYRGELERHEKIAFLQELDLMSVPTVYHESKGLSILEALANGVPVVLPNHGAFPEWIEETGGGVLVEPQSPQALAQAILHLQANPDQRQTLGRQGKAAAHQKFSAESVARRSLEVFSRYAAAGQTAS